MIKIFSIAALSIMMLAVNISCNSAIPPHKLNEKLTNNAVSLNQQNLNLNEFVEDVNLLCNKLFELKRMPHKDKVADDYVYDGLMMKANKAIPCLAEKITDLTIMDDPREAPHILDFRVGDAAVFMLHRITEEPLISILPDKFAKQWKTEGVYAYFAYVEKPEHRKKIKQWWKERMKIIESN